MNILFALHGEASVRDFQLRLLGIWYVCFGSVKKISGGGATAASRRGQTWKTLRIDPSPSSCNASTMNKYRTAVKHHKEKWETPDTTAAQSARPFEKSEGQTCLFAFGHNNVCTFNIIDTWY